MKDDVKKMLVNTFGRISYLFVIFFFFIFILYTHNNLNDPLKEAWTTSLTFLSILATISATIVASTLFIDWTRNAAYTRNENIINEFWGYYIESKIDLVSLQDLLKRPTYSNNILKITELFDSINNKLTRLYFYQQKLEIMLEIEIEDHIFSEIEEIIKQYILILDVHNFNLNLFLIEDQKLIDRLNILQPKLLKYMKELNEKNLK